MKPATRTELIARRPDGGQLLYGHAIMENRHGWRWPAGSRMPMAPPNAGLRKPAEARRKAAGAASRPVRTRRTIADHVANLRAIGVTPHVQNQAVTKTGKNATAPSTNEPRGIRYGMSQSHGDGQAFRMGKQHGTMRKTKHRGIARVAADFLLNLIAYNLIRIPKLLQLSQPASVHQHQIENYIQPTALSQQRPARIRKLSIQGSSADC